MIIIAAAPIPHKDEDRLREFCFGLEQMLDDRLSPAQKNHIRKFAPGGASLKARSSRCLSRLLALYHAPGKAIIDMDGMGLPFIPGLPSFRLAFSHSSRAAFCAIGISVASRQNARISIDAEWLPDAPPPEAIAHYFHKLGFETGRLPLPLGKNYMLRLWTIYEASLKNECTSKPDAFPQFALKRRSGTSASAINPAYWQSMSFAGHFVCVSSQNIIPEPVRRLWFDPCALPGIPN